MPSRSGSPIDFNQNDKEYWKGIVLLMIPGILFAILSVISLLIHCCYRCCCVSKSPSSNNNNNNNNNNNRSPPPLKKLIIIGAFFFIVSLVFCIVGLNYNEKTTSNISGTDGIITNGQGLLSDTILITNTLTMDLSTIISQTQTLSPTLQSRINSILSSMSNNLLSFDSSLSSTSSTLHHYSSMAINPSDPSDPNFNQPVTFSCGEPCSNAINQINSYQNNVDNTIHSLYNTIQTNLFPTIEHNIISYSSTIINQASSARATINDVNIQAKSHQGTTNDVADQTNNGDKNRRWAMILLFIIPLLSSILLLIAFFFHSRPTIKFSRVILSLFLPFLFVSFGIHMGLTALSADGCVYFDGKEVTLHQQFNSNTANVMEACLIGTNIMEPLNVNDPIQYLNNITFPIFPAVDIIVNNSDWAIIQSLSNTITPSLFGFDATAITDGLSSLNQLTTPDIYTINTINTCDYTKYSQPAAVRTGKNRVMTLLSAQWMINNAIQAIKSNFTNVNNAVSNAILNINTVRNEINNLNTLLTPLISSAIDLKDAAYCSALGNRYLIMKQSLCGSNNQSDTDKNSIALSMGLLTIACLLIAIGSIGLIIIAIKMENAGQSSAAQKQEMIASAGINPLQTTGSRV